MPTCAPVILGTMKLDKLTDLYLKSLFVDKNLQKFKSQNRFYVRVTTFNFLLHWLVLILINFFLFIKVYISSG